MLEQSGVFDDHGGVTDRVMDSGDLEREGHHHPGQEHRRAPPRCGKDGRDLIINVIDTRVTPTSAARSSALSMVDGVVLLVDASGPLPQTRFVLGKALAAKMPVIILVNKTDRPDARIDEVVEDAQDLLLELASGLEDPEAAEAAEQLLDLPVLYASGREGKASTENPGNGVAPDAADLQALFDVIYEVLRSTPPRSTPAAGASVRTPLLPRPHRPGPRHAGTLKRASRSPGSLRRRGQPAHQERPHRGAAANRRHHPRSGRGRGRRR